MLGDENMRKTPSHLDMRRESTHARGMTNAGTNAAYGMEVRKNHRDVDQQQVLQHLSHLPSPTTTVLRADDFGHD